MTLRSRKLAATVSQCARIEQGPCCGLVRTPALRPLRPAGPPSSRLEVTETAEQCVSERTSSALLRMQMILMNFLRLALIRDVRNVQHWGGGRTLFFGVGF